MFFFFYLLTEYTGVGQSQGGQKGRVFSIHETEVDIQALSVSNYDLSYTAM